MNISLEKITSAGAWMSLNELFLSTLPLHVLVSLSSTERAAINVLTSQVVTIVSSIVATHELERSSTQAGQSILPR